MNQKPKPDLATAKIEREKALRYDRFRGACQKEMTATVQKQNSKLGEIAKSLIDLLKALAMLGMSSEGDAAELAALEEEKEEECAATDLTEECAGKSDPLTARAGVSGSTGVTDLSGGLADSLFGQVPTGEVDNAGDTKAAAASGNNNFGSGSGFNGIDGGAPGSGVASASDGKEKIDTDIHKGYIGGGGGGGSGWSGGSGGSGFRSAGLQFGSNSKSSRSSGRKKLQSALDRVAKAGRGLASDGTNGPFQNIWGVVNKTYKKASPSMYHK